MSDVFIWNEVGRYMVSLCVDRFVICPCVCVISAITGCDLVVILYMSQFEFEFLVVIIAIFGSCNSRMFVNYNLFSSVCLFCT